ncbi:metallopeptidase [Paenibacillus jamilae]|uniref:Metallopeptidase n=1 Tax=Paenibacillus jamilae TaxID=114136 RepID=A0ACC4ZZ34_9BACL|nr:MULTISPECIES: nuclear transport factor 2 family protein [Paenibacillus]AUO05668.1 nuclear transport factor 2 family protein [Paenibacillus sp. lzh-N1]KTS83909.1 metallopeptidase [Paenibacillus jamilae]
MNRAEAKAFLTCMYNDIVVGLKVEKIPDYFVPEYIQVTDGVTTNLEEFTQHITTLKSLIDNITISPFNDFLYDDELQSVTLRYIVDITKKNGMKGQVELIAIFEFKDDKIRRCNELSCPLTSDESFKEIASINQK